MTNLFLFTILQIPEEIPVSSFEQYGLAGTFLVLCLTALVIFYKQNKKMTDTAIERSSEVEKEFKTYLKVSNEKMFDILKDYTLTNKQLIEAFDKNTTAFNKNTDSNEKLALLIESKLDIIDILKKTK